MTTVAISAGDNGIVAGSGDGYTLTLYPVEQLPDGILDQCYLLVRKIRALYLSASLSWSRTEKIQEMNTSGMWYLIARADHQEHPLDHSGQVSSAACRSSRTRSRVGPAAILGFTSFNPGDVDAFDYPCVYLYEIHVRREFQGRRLGAAMLEVVISKADQEHLPVNLTVFDFNKRARVFYETHGFTVVPLEDQRPHCLEMRRPPDQSLTN